jgi:hypothetical protein
VIHAYLNGILFTDWWFILLFLVVVFVVVDFAPDFALRPYISGKHVHAGAMLFAYIFGIAVFGFVGLFLGPMILIIATNFMKIVLPELRSQSRGVQNSVTEVWPWLVQMGQARGGMYSYEWLENLVGCDIHNADRIIPEFQQLEVGDGIRLHPKVSIPTAAIEPCRALVLHVILVMDRKMLFGIKQRAEAAAER